MNNALPVFSFFIKILPLLLVVQLRASVTDTIRQEISSSDYSEAQPVLTPDGRTMYFSRHLDPINLGAEDARDIWRRTRRKDGSWSRAVNIGSGLNSIAHEIPATLGLAERFIYFIRDNQVYSSRKEGRQWSRPKQVRLPADFLRISDVFVDADEQRLLICAERKDSLPRSLNIYQSIKLANGKWSELQSLGPIINTPQKESSVFLAPDGETLYFSSNGHPGLGGTDLFMTRRLDNTWQNWSKPVNLGLQINSRGNESHLSMPATASYICYAREEKGASVILEAELSENLRPEPMILLSGTIKGSNKRGSKLYVYPLADSSRAARRIIIPDAHHRYQLIIPQGQNLGLYAEQRGYFSGSQHLTLNTYPSEDIDKEQSALAAALRSDQLYQSREQDIERLQLKLNEIDKRIFELQQAQDDYIEELSPVLENPHIFKRSTGRNELALTQLKDAYQQRRKKAIFEAETSRGQLDIGALSELMSKSGGSSGSAIDQTPEAVAGLITEDPLVFEDFLQEIELQLQRVLFPSVLRKLEKEAALEVLQAVSASEKKRITEGSFSTKLLSYAQSGKLTRPIISALDLQYNPLPLSDWQRSFAADLSDMLRTEVEANMASGLKMGVRSFIENDLRKEIILRNRELLRREIAANVQQQIITEKELYRNLEEETKERFSRKDTLTIMGQYAYQQDIHLNTLLAGNEILLENVIFTANTPQFKPAAYADLDRLVALLDDYPALGVNISAHTNGQCSHFFAMSLTKERAEAVANYLIKKGIDARRISDRGVGKNQPLLPNTNATSLLYNQRIEINFFEL